MGISFFKSTLGGEEFSTSSSFWQALRDNAPKSKIMIVIKYFFTNYRPPFPLSIPNIGVTIMRNSSIIEVHNNGNLEGCENYWQM